MLSPIAKYGWLLGPIFFWGWGQRSISLAYPWKYQPSKGRKDCQTVHTWIPLCSVQSSHVSHCDSLCWLKACCAYLRPFSSLLMVNYMVWGADCLNFPCAQILVELQTAFCLPGPLGAEIKNLFHHFEAMIVRQNKDVLSHFGEVLKTIKFT